MVELEKDRQTIAAPKNKATSAAYPSCLNEDVALLVHNARRLYLADEIEDCLVLLREGLRLEPANTKTLLFLHQVLDSNLRVEEAIAVLEYNQKWNYSLQGAIKLSTHYINESRLNDALMCLFDILSQVTEDESLQFATYKNIGHVYLKENEIDLAEEYFHKAFAINAVEDSLLVNLGVLNYIKKDFESSKSYLKQALSVNGDNSKAWVGLGMVHIEHGDRELGWSNLIKAIDVDPYNRSALILLSDLAETDRELHIIQEKLVQFLECYNFDEEISHLLINNFIKRNDFGRAQLEALKIYLWNPENSRNQDIYNKITQFIAIKEKEMNYGAVST